MPVTLNWLIGALARDTSVWTDDVWVVDSTPVQCARSREAVRRSDLAGWVGYGYCASHSRYFWGLRLHLLATLQGLAIGFALTAAKADERQILLDILQADPTLTAGRPGQLIFGDKNYFLVDFEATPRRGRAHAAAPDPQGRTRTRVPASSNPCAGPSNRSSTRSRANSTSKTTAAIPPAGVLVRVLQRILA